MRAAYVAAGIVAGTALWWYMDRAQGEGDTSAVDEVIEDAAQTVDEWTGGMMQLSGMSKVNSAHLSAPNVQAFLRVIRKGEGTSDQGGYSRLFGGGNFSSFADHPRRTVTRGGYVSTAAGAYQFLSSTWDETARIMGLRDFSPASQDLGAVGRIAARGALGDVLAGRFEVAVRKCAKEWASLPFSPYGQPTISIDTAMNTFIAAGGEIA